MTIKPLTSDNAPPRVPELRPFDPTANPRSWVPEEPPTWIKESAGLHYRIGADAVYRFYDAERCLLYIGMTSSSPYMRWTDHRRTAKWWSLAAYVSIEWVVGGNAAAVEKAAIQAERPPFNKAHMRSRSSFMVYPSRGPAAVIEQFRNYLLPEDFKALADAFKAEDI